MLREEPYLLTQKEAKEIARWQIVESAGITLPTTYDEDLPRAAKNSIKTMPYYKENK